MIFQNPNEVQDKIFDEIRKLISDLASIESREELENNYEKIQHLYEKMILFKKIGEEDIIINENKKNTEDFCGWQSFSNVYMNIEEDIIINEKKDSKNLDPIDEKNIKVDKVVSEGNNEQKIKLEPIKAVKSKIEGGEVKKANEEKNNVFGMDLNDRITFLKKLFSGDEVGMTIVLNKLYNSKTLLEANEYLSEVYHEKDWSSVDEYAQRLWALVERRF